MAEGMKTITFNPRRGARRLHIEGDGFIVNITGNLHDAEGRQVVRVDVKADRYADSTPWNIPDVPTVDELAAYLATNGAGNGTLEEYRATLQRAFDTIESTRDFVGIRVRSTAQ